MSVAEFLDMGGYALYVWGSFGVSALLMILEPIMLRNHRRAVLQRIARIIRIKAGEKV
ncbi:MULTISPECIES: heme exporter protein CcmD [Sedimenticola]|uniref:Heme exporter protein D n=1 Tax=Sedimenticola selenatireducens TaxID=191960 RepID=A0A2N6CZF4_9GAMM|nr:MULTISPECIES: heme exporter protein CcmD [Sedimenticola]MCW8903918.1 heme exporter protein CcmD [Sedimenticola sp.]PLX62763.1 MAG: heme exporter protein CcmD [Sedimenticola selenatireducens]